MQQLNINLLIELIKVIAIMIASGVAIYGINSWRREQVWRKKYELAEEVLSLVYEIEDTFRSLRHPFYSVNEGKTRVRSDDEDERESVLLDRAYVVFERYDKNKESFNKLRVVKYRFMTIYGSDKGQIFDKVDSLLRDVFHAANVLGNNYWPNQGTKDWKNDEEFKKHLEEKWKFEKVIWSTGEEGEFELKLKGVISEFEKECKTIINKNKLSN